MTGRLVHHWCACSLTCVCVCVCTDVAKVQWDIGKVLEQLEQNNDEEVARAQQQVQVIDTAISQTPHAHHTRQQHAEQSSTHERRCTCCWVGGVEADAEAALAWKKQMEGMSNVIDNMLQFEVQVNKMQVNYKHAHTHEEHTYCTHAQWHTRTHNRAPVRFSRAVLYLRGRLRRPACTYSWHAYERMH